jgi:hypothetical protein
MTPALLASPLTNEHLLTCGRLRGFSPSTCVRRHFQDCPRDSAKFIAAEAETWLHRLAKGRSPRDLPLVD